MLGSWRAFVVIVVAMAVVVAAGCGDDDDAPSSTPASEQSEAIPPEVREHAVDWPLPGQDYANSRAAVGSTIDSSNIDQLVEVWTADVEFGLTTVPIIIGDSVYVQDRSNGAYALDFATGAVRWSRPAGEINAGPNGVAVGWGKVFGVSSEGAFALDAATGTEVWNVDLTITETDGVDIQPTVYDGKVIVSTVPISVQGQYEGGDRGIVYALDAETGAVAWQWDTVDSEDVWGNAAVNSGGGAWYPPAIDSQAGTIYMGVANPAPFPGTAEFPNGSSRPGDNLYTNTASALDAESGELQWYYQVHPHDLFDRDQVHTMLVELADDDERVLVSAGKGGRVVGLEPSSGELLWDTSVGLHRNDELTELSGPTEIAPGTFGGILTPPSTADGAVYVAVVNAPQTLVPDEEDYFGADMGQMDGEVVAVDGADGRVLWQTVVPGDPTGGTTVINDLVLTATLQGGIYALDRASGEIVWEMQAAGGIIGWPAVAGDTIIVPVGNQNPPRVTALRLPE